MLRNFIFCFLLVALAACQPVTEPAKPKGVLRIATVPVDMPIIVDGEPKGNSPSEVGQYFSISLEEGDHEIEILKSIDEEKEQYAKKTIFIAADTIPIVTLEAKERLTPFGVEEKTRKNQKETNRVAELRKALMNQISFLNATQVRQSDHWERNGKKRTQTNLYSYEVNECDLIISEQVIAKSLTFLSMSLKEVSVSSNNGLTGRSLKCDKGKPCISIRYKDSATNKMTLKRDVYGSTSIFNNMDIDGTADPRLKISNAFKQAIKICKSI